MKRKFISLLLACVMVLSLCGCGGKAGEIAASVIDAAAKELKNQVTALLAENKLEIVELKTAFGQLNDDSKYQFFIAALVRSESAVIPQSTADTLNKMFTEAGLTVQTDSALESPYLVYKTITFNHSDFSGGNYYVIYAYQGDLTATLPDINATLPTQGTSQPAA